MSVHMSPSEVCSEIKRLEENPQHESPGPAINNLPAVRGGRGGSMEGGGGTKSSSTKEKY